MNIQEMKMVASNKGYYIWSSVGDAGLGHFEFTPSAYIQSSIFGELNMDNFLGKSEEDAVEQAFNFILDYIFKDESDKDFIEQYKENKYYAQSLYSDFIDKGNKWL